MRAVCSITSAGRSVFPRCLRYPLFSGASVPKILRNAHSSVRVLNCGSASHCPLRT